MKPLKRPLPIAMGVAAALLGVLLGCGPAPEPAFRAYLEGLKPDALSERQRRAIDAAVVEWFGTPDSPRAPEASGLDLTILQRAAGPPGRDLNGNRQGLYRQQCAACHGIAGDGAGPLARMCAPYPRDFRQGLYKYTSTIATARATPDDLRRAIVDGFPATGMPAFPSLSSSDLDALIEYLRYLGLRGQAEQMLVDRVANGIEFLPLSRDGQQYILDYGVARFAREWDEPVLNPAACVILPPPRPSYDTVSAAAAAERGKAHYANDQVKCVTCHGVDGRGDGENSDLWDDWNRPKVGVNAMETARLAERFRLPVQKLRPRDFTQGLYRGGASDEDLYRRLHAGIKGTPMTPAGASPGVPALLTDDEIWEIIFYLRSLER